MRLGIFWVNNDRMKGVPWMRLIEVIVQVTLIIIHTNIQLLTPFNHALKTLP